MSVLLQRAARCRSRSVRPLGCRADISKRGVGSLIQPLADGFLSLANTLPIPAGCPPYATTIILTTLFIRSTITLPIQLWTRRKARHLEQVVKPELERDAGLLREIVTTESRKRRLPYDEYKKELSRQLTAKRKELYRKHGVRPVLNLVLSPLVHIPLFFTFSFALRAAALPPSPLASESFASIASLASNDITGIMPVLFGLTTLANIEVGRLYAAVRPGPAVAPGAKVESKYGRIMENAMRCGAVVMIPVAANVPGALVIYWSTSAAFTLVQNILLGVIDENRRKNVPLASPDPPKAATKAATKG